MVEEFHPYLQRPHLRVKAAALYLGISPESLAQRNWRLRHGIPWHRIGKAVVFDPDQLDAWLRSYGETVRVPQSL
jgi:hypothetical protein